MKKVFALVLSIIMLAGAAVAVFSAEESPFSDVKETRWSYEAIQYAVEKGYMNGVGEGRFDPAGQIKQVIEIISILTHDRIFLRHDSSPPGSLYHIQIADAYGFFGGQK